MQEARLSAIRDRLGRLSGRSRAGEAAGLVGFGSGGPGGIARGALHEIVAPEGRDAAAATGFALALAFRAAGVAEGPPVLWVRQELADAEAGALHAPGLAAFGLDPGRLVRVRAREAVGLLQAGLEGARCAALGAVAVELWGRVKALDLTAGRRLALAARASGVTLLLVRVAAPAEASAAETRHAVCAAPSRPLAANAPGHPAFRVTLLRRRGGGGGWGEGETRELEWNRDTGCFEDRIARLAGSSPAEGAAPPLSRPLVPLPARRAGGAEDARRAGGAEDARHAG
jgi:protein ImuA